MLSLPGRNGRRRRVLNDEVLSASSSHVALRAMSDDTYSDRSAPRYSDAAGVENHPQVTDFIPRRYRSIALLVLSGVATTSLLGALHHFALPIAAACGLTDTRVFDLSAHGSLGSWIAAVELLAAAVACVLVYSIRRHRIDDYRGRYRVWFAAAIACLLLSVNSVVGLHDVLAQAITHYTGWSALRDNAVWWLALAVLPLAWIAVRTLIDVRECRLALLLLSVSLAAYVAAAASFLGLIPAELPVETLTTGAATVLGGWLLLASVVSYARYVVLDAQGLVPVIIRRASASKPHGTRTASVAPPVDQAARPAGKSSVFAAAGLTRPTQSPPTQPAKDAATPTQWIDGSRAERDNYDDDEDDTDDRKLSKSERKRLRKLKARNRAA